MFSHTKPNANARVPNNHGTYDDQTDFLGRRTQQPRAPLQQQMAFLMQQIEQMQNQQERVNHRGWN